ncbi:RmlC-like cupin domain-containing protein [Epithele typhae]|uniref:RmlC-like cupin domain-containing protein n=1 Tax=Epithele typhae TaxID=378194 RepID=UPI002007367C|nr:RmlC-like cupin domain-containing protein [Epithele typhae]KAH9919450.1 RmlC-like cupin domain-containing protein [Epithele typhae]
MTVTPLPTYSSYAIPNSALTKQLKLQRHPEGGYFVETDRQDEQIPSPFADQALRPLATSIYYLLTPEEPNGVFHMNKSATMHVLHQGRAEYTLITPGSPPRIERKVMGPNIHAGETMQLLVGSGVWKMSRLLTDDLKRASTPEAEEHCGCLITEVVFPGFHWEDHCYLSREEFDKLWGELDPPQGLLEYIRTS